MKIFFAEHFKNQLRKLKKKYPKVKNDILEKLENINLKTEIYIGRSIYKLRIKSSDQKKGKSGGFRSYVYLYLKKDLLVPLCIYAKSETGSISENELKYHFDNISVEMLKTHS
ncbi:type II toxin-antitoxin system RelE/ParE family toxin [Candidatus Gracilibacteria bacterium]|nr:type II toxin-antitoxin system RelE/ParE family toxin [Candidatus Gracilibacteria bacterium]